MVLKTGLGTRIHRVTPGGHLREMDVFVPWFRSVNPTEAVTIGKGSDTKVQPDVASQGRSSNLRKTAHFGA